MPSSTKAAAKPSPAAARPKAQPSAKNKTASQQSNTRTAQGKPAASTRSLPAFAAAGSKAVLDNRVSRTSSIDQAPRILTPLDTQSIRRPGGGQPLPAHVLDALQNSLRVDLSPVRLHTGTAWEKRAQLLHARAFTFGPDIFLGPGEHPSDLSLLSHEAAHVLHQQSKTRIQAKSAARGDTMESEADQTAAATQNQQQFSVKERVSSQNGQPQNGDGAEAHRPGKPGAHAANAKPVHAATVRDSQQKHGTPLTDGKPGEQTAEKKEKEIPDKDAISQLHGSWAALPMEIASASLLSVPFDAPHSLELHPQPAPSGTKKPTPEAEQNKIVRDAVEAYSGFHHDAESAHARVVAKSNDIRRTIVSEGRDILRQVDRVTDMALGGALSALAADRSMIDSGAVSALQALDRGEAIARVQLGGAAAGAYRRIADQKSKVGDAITRIEDKLRKEFLDLYLKKADEVEAAGIKAAQYLGSPATHASVQASISDRADAPGAAAVEAERASVPRYLVDLSTAVTASYEPQTVALRCRIATPPSKGPSLEEAIKQYAETIRKSAIGDGSSGGSLKTAPAKPEPADDAPGAGPAKVTKDKSEPVYTQANHAVDQAYSQAIGSLRSQVAAARKSIEAARRSAQEQCSAQRTAIFAQLTNVRQTHVANVQHATANAVKTVEDGARSALTMYPESCRSVAQSLQDAAQKGHNELAQTTQSSVPGARRSSETAESTQIKRLEQVGDDACGALKQQGAQAAEGSSAIKESFAGTVGTIALSTSMSMSDVASRQVQGFKGLSAGIAAATAQFTQPIDKLFEKSIDKTKKESFDPILAGETASVGALAKNACDSFEDKSNNPLAAIQERLTNVSSTLDTNLQERAKSAYAAWGIINLDEDGLMASLRGVTAIQGAAIEFYFHKQSDKNLRDKLWDEYQALLTGLNENEYYACINYLNGNTSQGALYELRTAKGWFSSDAKKAEDVMRALTPAERHDTVNSPEWGSVASDVRDGLSGDDLEVFNALEGGKVARADAIRLRENVRKAKENNDKDALFKALENYHPGGATDFLTTVRSDIQANQQATQATQLQQGGLPATPEQRQPAIGETDEVSFKDVQNEFAKIEPPAPAAPGEAAKTQAPGDALAAYVLKPTEVQIPNEDGSVTTVTYTVEGPDAVLARTLAMEGPGTVNSRAARLYREAEKKKDEKLDLEPLENAVIDPRLNKALPQGRGLDDKQREHVREEQDQVFLAYAKLLKDNNAIAGEITDAKQAREIAADHLGTHFDKQDEKGKIGAQYAASIVKDDVPDAVAALRYAQLGAGTDEDLIHRTFQRMSRADIDKARVDYQNRYDGADLFADLGLYGKGSFGELSGDDRLQAEREAMGVPQNDREAAEVALFTNRQQKKETGAIGQLLVGEGEEKALVQNERKLVEMAGGVVGHDDLGRPLIPEDSPNFKDGAYIGGDKREFSSELTMARIAAENYEASIDRITTAITTAIAIIGAVVATVVTLGAGAPILAAVLIAGATGLASMGASRLIKGGRYGWEEGLKDLGMTGIQMLTAGIGASLGAAAKVGTAATEAAEAAEVAEEAAATAAKTAEKAGEKAAAIGKSIKIGAVTGGIGGAGNAAFDERTWKDGIGAGIGNVFMGGARGAVGGAVGGAASGALEHLSLGGNLFKGPGLLNSGGRMLVGGVGRGLTSSAGAVGGRAGELLFDEATGQYHGTMKDAIASLGEAGEQPLLQGFLEGAAHTAAKPWADRKHAERDAQLAHKSRNGGMQMQEPASGSSPLPEEELQRPPALDHEIPAAHPEFENVAGLPALSAGEGVPAMPKLPEGEADALPKQPAETAGGAGGEGGMRPPGSTPPPSSGDDRLLPDITDPEMDKLFEDPSSKTMLEVSGQKALDESLGLRLPAEQGGSYWGLDPASGMTVQEYQFLSERGLPSVDSKGDPIPGPRGNKMTKMRIHSPDPTAPAGSASHEDWTMNLVQGKNMRMTADGVWFDKRYGAMPDGSKFNVEPFRRGPAGEWVEASSGKPVTNPNHLAALDDWDHKMASSHIPLFRDAPPLPAPPSTPPTPAVPPELPPLAPHTGAMPEAESGRSPVRDNTAGGIEDSRFTGDAAEKFGLPRAESPDEALRKLARGAGVSSEYTSLAEQDGRISRVELETKAVELRDGEVVPVPVKVKVRFEMVDKLPLRDGIMPVAEYDQVGNTNEYIVRISRGAPAEMLERGIAHELAEIRAKHRVNDVSDEHGDVPDKRGPAKESEDRHALAPGSTATTLSPHDEGRLAEVQVLARQLKDAKGAARNELLNEAQKLARHLGLTGDENGASFRKALALGHLEDSNDRKWLKIAIELPEENPFQRRLRGDLRQDLRTLAKRIELAQKLGELAPGRRRWTGENQDPIIRDAIEIMRQSLLRDGIVKMRDRATYLDMDAKETVGLIQEKLGTVEENVERFLFDAALEEAKGYKSYKLSSPDPGDLDPSTVEATRAAFGKDDKFLDWPAFRKKYIEKNPSVILADRENPDEANLRVTLRERKLFDSWASGSLIDDETGRVRSLLSEKTGPDKGFEAKYLTKPAEALGLKLANELEVGRPSEKLTLDDATKARFKLLEDASEQRAALKKAQLVEDDGAIRAALDKLGELTKNANDISEAFGMAAGLAYAEKMFPGAKIFPGSGAHVFDLIVQVGKEYVIIECKGGDSPLGDRMDATETFKVQQGTREYVSAVAHDLMTSPDPAMRAMAEALFEKLENNQDYKPKYYVVRQGFDVNGQPTTPTVGEFDMKRNQPAPAELKTPVQSSKDTKKEKEPQK